MKECEAAVKSLMSDIKDQPPLPLLETLAKNLKRQSSRIRQTVDETAERLSESIGVAKKFADQQEFLTRSLAEAHSSSPLQLDK